MNKILNTLKKYLDKSDKNMSAYGKLHLLKGNYDNVEEGMNSGTFVYLNKTRIIKSYLNTILHIIIYKNKYLFNSFIKKYKLICKKQSRLFDINLLYHSMVLKLLTKHNVLKDNICVIGDGKANFVHGILDLKNISKIYSINLPQALIQDYHILSKHNSIDEKLIKVVDSENDINDNRYKLFLIPAANKNFLRNKNINLFVNMFSFQEMPLSEIRAYIDIALSNSAYLYQVNREEKIMYDGVKINYNDYFISSKKKKILAEYAKFANYYTNRSFPFIHKKKSKIIHSLFKF